MIWAFDLITLIFLVITAIISLQTKDLLSAAMIFGVYSFLMCLLWAGMAAVDVAFTESAVGAGVSAVFLIATMEPSRVSVNCPTTPYAPPPSFLIREYRTSTVNLPAVPLSTATS